MSDQRTSYGFTRLPKTPIPKAAKVSGMQYVSLLRTGGTDGALNELAACTYQVHLADGTLVGDGIAPLMQRWNTAVAPATHGLGFFDSTGTFILVWCDEVPVLTPATFVEVVIGIPRTEGDVLSLQWDNP